MSSPLKVLVLEDNPVDTELMLQELRGAGIDSDWVRVDNEEEYLRYLQPDLDLILSDFQMPQFTATRALELLKERGLDIPFILISSTIGEDAAVEAMKHGATDYLPKDRLSRLGSAVRHALEQRPLRKNWKIATETLRLRETALNVVSQGVLICDENRLIIYANSSFTKLCGYAESEVLGRNCSILQGLDSDRETILKIRAALDAEEPFEGEILNYRKDGQPFWNELSIAPLRDEEDGPLRFIGIQRDVTERKQEQEALRRKETEMRVLFNLIPAMIWVKDAENGFLRVNQRVADATGMRIEDIEGKSAYEIFPQEAAGYYADDLEVIHSGSPKMGIIEKLQGPEDQERWVQTDKVPVLAEDGKVIGLVALVHDITERKLAEAALKEIELRYHSLFENMVEGFCICRLLYKKGRALDYIFLDVNRAFESQTGLKNVVGKKVSAVVPGMHEANPEQLQIFSRVALTRKTEKFETYVKLLGIWLSVTVYSHQAEHFIAVFDNITVRKQAEKALRESEELFARAFEQAPIGIALRSLEGRWLKVNQALCEVVGFSEAELLARTFQDIIHPEDLAADLVNVNRLLAGETNSYQMEKRYLHALGHSVEVLASISLVRDGQGQPQYFIAQIQDITERKRLESEMERQRSEHENVLNALGEGVHWIGIDGRIKFENPAAAKMLGYEIFELIGKPAHDTMHHTRADGTPYQQSECPIYATLRDGVVRHSADEVFWRKDGTSFTVEYTCTPVYERDGRSRGSVVIFSDVTERKRAEEKLRESQHFAESIAENSTSVIYLYDFNTHRTIYTNRNGAESLGYSKAQILELGENFLPILLHPEDMAPLLQQTAKFAETPDGHVFDLELRMKHATGGWRWFWTRETIFNRHPDGTPWQILGTAQDITERKQAEEMLAAALAHEKELSEQARAGDRAKGEFLAVMSHEIRTPLNGILGFSELLARTPDLPAESREYVQTITSSGEALLRILNDVLDSSRLDAGQVQIEKSPFAPREILSDIRTLISQLARDKELVLGVSVEPSIPEYLKGDAGRLRQILLNLGTNAIKFTENGCVTLGLRRMPGASKYEFYVKDTGCGIASAQIEHLFQPFTQADSSTSRSHGGTGLGLSISRRLAELLGGTLIVRSRPHHGSEFILALTLDDAGPSPERTDGTLTLDSSFAVAHPLRIVVVEDDKVNLKLMLTLIRRLGYQPLSAKNGREAVEIHHHEQPDCILMDLQMPEMDGIEATAKIREMEKASCPAKPVFISALTANIVPADRQRCFDAGMNSYLSKPVKLDDLAAVLAEASDSAFG